MALFTPAAIRLQPYFGFRSATRLKMTARALRAPARDGDPFARRGRLLAVGTMLRQFASREVPELAVRLELKAPGGRKTEHRAVTDADGFVHFDVPLDPPWPLPADPAWEVVCLHWLTADGPQCVDGHVLAPGTITKLAVVSDIDDTIIETGVTGGLRALARNWRRLLAEMPDERAIVPGADVFYGAIGGGAVLAEAGGAGTRLAATHRPFFYVSSSPWNLYAYLVAFQRSRKLPLGPLLLRDWDLNAATFGHSSHGAHKEAALAALMAFYPDMRFALIGDDTQADLPAYAAAAARFPGRVAAVFVRTGAGPLSPEEAAGKAALEAARVPLWLGDDFAIGADFLKTVGISTNGETAQIVKTVQKEGVST